MCTTMSTRFSQYYIVLVQEAASFWRENVVAVVNLLRVLAQMSCWQKQDIKCRLSLIVRVNVVLNRTVVLTVTDVLTTCAVVIFRVKVSCITSVDSIMLWLYIWSNARSFIILRSGKRVTSFTKRYQSYLF